MSWHGFVRLAPNARLILLPTCSSCKKVAPKCECGYPAWKQNGR